ncbi:pantetheine-phosphate adenylyltransferase [Jidongwangia harbinensis]|uniref:pantetheine-phosphate adenylyltransferase n=1 Tax=Jidongwangia harbinensis TaxID=2878561 RepID=UPI001CD9D8FC|nr:pantetheine-phosphate adenylyltransferase [Jidongwangia harbinensis]MCA2215336.1 pantetheine-phosphate adenylyltransferase [Jidongwangia harbinensis]
MIAVYPGSFDPFTAGHADVARRALQVFDRLVVLVAVNPEKAPATASDRRAELIRARLDDDRVRVEAWTGLTAEYCLRHDIPVIIRGVRNATDAIQEYALAAMNARLGVQTLLLGARPDLATVSSTTVRSLDRRT